MSIVEKPPRTGTAALSQVADRQAIAATLARHSRGVDRNDLALLRSAYHADAQVSYGMFNGPAADMAAYLTGSMLGQPTTLHRTSNMWIALDGDRARSESYVIAYLSTPDGDAGQVQRLIGGRYLDRHERRDGAWRIVHRTYVMDWNSNRPGTEAPTDGSAVALDAFAPRGGQLNLDPGTTLLALWKTRQDQPPAERTPDMQPQETPTAIDAVIARDAIHQLAVAYCRGVDRADAALIRSVFHEDGSFLGAGLSGSADSFAAATVDLVRTALKTSFHSIANEWVEVNGDHAIGEIYVIAFSRTNGGPDGDQDNFIGGRYLDRYERRAGAWKIAERVFVQDWMTTHPSTHQEEGMYEQLPTRGRFVPDDPVYAFWAA